MPPRKPSTSSGAAATPEATIGEALFQVFAAVGYVRKEKTNQFHHYKYVGEDDLLEHLRPAMIEHGLLLIPSQENVSGIDQWGNVMVRVDYTLLHRSGAVWPEKIKVYGCGNDKNKGGVGDKGIYKAVTGANKYLLFKLFQIATGDDPERVRMPPAPQATAAAEDLINRPVDGTTPEPYDPETGELYGDTGAEPQDSVQADWAAWVSHVETQIVNAPTPDALEQIRMLNAPHFETLRESWPQLAEHLQVCVAQKQEEFATEGSPE